MKGLDGVEVRPLADAAAWESWLADNHGRQAGIWVKVARRSSGIPSVTDDELVDGGLCWGWISGQRKSFDEHWYLQRYVPRRPRSLWSRVNVEKVETLLAAGRMREPGLAEVRAAQADGRWAAAYASQKTATVPPEVVAALASDPTAKDRFESLDRTRQYQLYLPILQAAAPKVRAARVEKLIAMLRRGETPPDGGELLLGGDL
jgi:uncharacterized protein YdeI (YjbR/CyaY-like superfamily)